MKNIFLCVLILLLTVNCYSSEKEISFGKKVDIHKYVVNGKTNIFDFYSIYCPPCMAIKPMLEKLGEKNKDVNIVKVNINREGIKGIDWRSPVIKQYKIKSVPHFKIIDKNGKLIEGKEARNIVEKLITPYKFQVLNEKCKKNPNDIRALYNRASYYFQEKNYKKAINDYETILTLSKKYYIVYYNLACVYSLNNQKNEAIKNLKTALKMANDKNDKRLLNDFKKDKDLINLYDLNQYKRLLEKY